MWIESLLFINIFQGEEAKPIDLFTSVTQNNNFSYFSYKHKTTSIDRFIMPNLVYVRGFIRICRKLVEIWDAKLAIFYRELYGRGRLEVVFCLYEKIQKIVILRDNGKKVYFRTFPVRPLRPISNIVPLVTAMLN